MATLAELLAHGQSCWMDDLSRAMLRNGAFAHRLSQGIRGITTNPTIFHAAINGTDVYDAQLQDLARRGTEPGAALEALEIADVREACDALRPVFDASHGIDGYVSLEVSPHLAHDTEGTMRDARRLFSAVQRPNLFIKIPGSPAGVPAIEQMLYEGLNINITLLFSVARYREVACAYLRALRRRVEAGKSVHGIASVASFFLSRIDVLVDQLLTHRSGLQARGRRADDLVGQAALANAKLAYQVFRELFAGPEWDQLAAAGARVQRVLWASTSTKNPRYSDVKYVEPLIGPQTINTMPERTIDAFLDHGRVALTLTEAADEARQVMDTLAALGIEFGNVTWQLLNEGVQKFIEPYDAVLKSIAEKLRQLPAHAA